MNVEHLLNVFISIDTDSEVVLDACSHFMNHLYWHKPRQTVLGPKIEGLPGDNPSKLKCLTEFSRLFVSVGNPAAQKRLLSRVLEPERERGDECQVAQVLHWLSDANRLLGFLEEGIEEAREALKISERLCGNVVQARCLTT